jgi:hypothetical protein
VEKIRKVNFLFLLGFLLSLGVVDFSTAQWESFSPEVRRWEIEVESGQFWPVYRDRGFPRRGFERAKDHRAATSLPKGRMLKPEEANTISGIIKNDYLVNDDTTGEREHGHPAVAMDTAGNFVICFQMSVTIWTIPISMLSGIPVPVIPRDQISG